ncbi:MAG: hypothetical protein SCALA702_01060 [Melioribacteraceae bacterium]|nr:MAG: hypothetical protein SCALA702_01060 [Melioribacteraceae bacterium]
MKEQQKENIAILNKVFEEVTNSFIEDQDSIFFDIAERNKNRYKELERKLKIWNASRQCIVRNCNKKSIVNSHTIQKKGSLYAISEANHLLTPLFDTRIEGLSLKRVGLNRASTFPGFCIQHENMFQAFENKDKFEYDEDFQLQVFRTISRELVIKQMILEQYEKMLENYIDFRNQKLIALIKERIGNKFLRENDINIKSLSFGNIDVREEQIKKQIKNFNEDICSFEFEFYTAICNDIEKGTVDEISIKVLHLDFQIPVSLAGRGNFHWNEGSHVSNIEIVFLVLPFSNHTYIIGATPKKHKLYLEKYFNSFSRHPLTLLVMVEGWMLYGSDHWFLKPSVWGKIKPEMQKNIIRAVENIEKDIGFICVFSVFNDLRESILTKLVDINLDELTPSFKMFVINEKDKLYKSLKCVT